MILAPSAWNTVSKDRVNLASRSRIRNRGAMPSPTSLLLTFRACCVTQAPSGFFVTPARCTPPGLEFDEGQYVEGLQEDCLHREEVAGQGAGCLGAKELFPRRPSSGCRADARSSEDRRDRRGGHADAQAEELSLDPPVAPPGVLPRQAKHQAPDLGIGRRTPRPAVRSRPFPRHQLAVPPKEGLRLHEERPPCFT